jgi:hypothetical protein
MRGRATPGLGVGGHGHGHGLVGDHEVAQTHRSSGHQIHLDTGVLARYGALCRLPLINGEHCVLPTVAHPRDRHRHGEWALSCGDTRVEVCG